MWHHDQPFGDSSALPTYLLSELTKGHVTVALSGDGGDELFAGYERFAAAVALEHVRRIPAPARQAALGAVARLPSGVMAGRGASLARFLARAHLDTPMALLSWINYVPAEWRAKLIEGDQWAVEQYLETWQGSEGAPTLSRILDLNLRTYLLDDLLPKVDRMAMAHGLEVRSPFLDTELVELALRLPPELHLRGMSLKRVLKAAVADVLPTEILYRKKRGFGVPLGRWFRTDLRPYTEAMLAAPSSRLRHHVSGQGVEEMLAEHMSGRVDHGHSLWTLLTLEVFLRREGW